MGTNIYGKAGAFIDLHSMLDVDLSEDLKSRLRVEAESWIYGTGARGVNVVFADTRTLTDGANETLDLYASGRSGYYHQQESQDRARWHGFQFDGCGYHRAWRRLISLTSGLLKNSLNELKKSDSEIERN